MSDEFTKVATTEINEELEANSQILKSCKTDEDVEKKCSEIEGHLHKIKGLAPMIRYNSIGELASLTDSLIKQILDGEKIKGIFETLNKSNQLMIELMHDSTINIDELKQSIKTKYSVYFD